MEEILEERDTESGYGVSLRIFYKNRERQWGRIGLRHKGHTLKREKVKKEREKGFDNRM